MTGGEGRCDGAAWGAGRDARGLCGAAPHRPLDEQWGSSLSRSCSPSSRCLLSHVPSVRSLHLHQIPPNSSAGRPAPAAVGALLFSDVTLEHKQLCSRPVNYIMSNEKDQAEGIKL